MWVVKEVSPLQGCDSGWSRNKDSLVYPGGSGKSRRDGATGGEGVGVVEWVGGMGVGGRL